MIYTETGFRLPTVTALALFFLACDGGPVDKPAETGDIPGSDDSADSGTDSGNESGDTGQDSGSDSGNDSGDTGQDSGSDSGNDSGDTGQDSGSDSATDTGDSAEDSGSDSATDTGDSAEDSGSDSATDTGDSAEDSGSDSATDTGTDSADTGWDTSTDTAWDTGVDTGDSATDTGAETGTDSGDTSLETGSETGGDTDSGADSGSDSGTDTGDGTSEETGDSGEDTGDGTSEETGDSGEDTGEDTGSSGDPPAPEVTFDFMVCGDGTGDYLEIQDAIDAASPGDSIGVCPGTYDPILVLWSWDVYVTSTEGRDVTFIDGGSGPAVVVDNGTLTISGFEVSGTSTIHPTEGAAFSVHEGDLTVSNCRVTDTSGSFALLFDENFLAMDDVEWIDNVTDFLWYFSEGDNVDIEHNTVIGGTHESVLTTPDLDNMHMVNNVFMDVRISAGFTAFSFTSNGIGTLGIYNNVFYNIDDDDPWGGRTVDLDGVDFRNNIIAKCDAGGLYAIDADYNIFWDNFVSYSAFVSGTGNQFVDPQFTNAAGGDFTLQSSSPAIDAGDADYTFDDVDDTPNDIGRYGGRDGADADTDTDSDTDSDTDPDTGTDVYTLTVTDGYGSGSYKAGEVVHVWANVDPTYQIVDAWSGGTLTNGEDWNSEFVMPAADTTLLPDIDDLDLPLIETSYTLAGTLRTVLYAIPSSPRGIVYYFHSALGNHAQIKENGPSSVARRLYNEGYGIVSMDSDIAAIAGSGGWSDAQDDETLDLAATRELRVELAYWGTPIIAWGVGSGGQMAHSMGVGMSADAVISYCAPGRRHLVESTDAPTVWFLAERDSTYTSAQSDVEDYVYWLNARGVFAEMYVHPPTPLYAERFERVSGVDAALSAEIAAGLLADGYVDADGNWLVTGEDATDNLWSYGLTTDQHEAVSREIRIMAADGELYDDYSAATVAFLNAYF